MSISQSALAETAAGIVGRDAVRPGGPADEIDGVRPSVVVQPSAPEAVGATLEWASREKLSVLTRGAGTKLGWGAPPAQIDVLLSTTRLSAVVAHRHGDLTATVQAGATLAQVNTVLAQRGQWIPLDPPSADRATIGGIVAANDSGPRRHRYGAARDLIIGVEFARSDGALAKGGGIVVKNVAGYDLPRLMAGSFGSLAVILSATFKLYPLTTASVTLVVEAGNTTNLGSLAALLLGSQLTPTALDFATGPLRLMIRFESIPVSVEQQSETAAKLVARSGFTARAVSGAEENQLWQAHASFADDPIATTIKVSVLPAELPATLSRLDELMARSGYSAAGRAGLGVFLARLSGDIDGQASVISALRESLPVGRGSVVIRNGPPELRRRVDPWGPIGDGLPLMRAVKRQLDQAGILNMGRGPGNL